MRPFHVALAPATFLVLLALIIGPATADEHYAPPDRPGPSLQVSTDALDDSLTCAAEPTDGTGPAVLLVHGTNLTYEDNFSWNHLPALQELGRLVCGVDLPVYGMHDIQVAAEHVVHAIRTVADRSGGPIQIVGFSQGGMIPRWALRWWPDTRPLIEDVVGLAPSNHGTATASATCGDECYPSYWQQRLEAAFIGALNSHTETFDTIDYTNVYTRYDEIVQPNLDDTGSSSLDGGRNVTNVATQDVCPNNTAEHLALGSYDPVGYALAVDAIEHPGPADLGRIALEVCAQTVMPGVDETTVAQDYAAMLATIDEANQAAEQVAEEPPLACYVTASCTQTGPGPDGADAGSDNPAAPDPGPSETAATATPATGGGAGLLGVAGLLAALVAGGASRGQHPADQPTSAQNS